MPLFLDPEVAGDETAADDGVDRLGDHSADAVFDRNHSKVGRAAEQGVNHLLGGRAGHVRRVFSQLLECNLVRVTSLPAKIGHSNRLRGASKRQGVRA